MKKKLVSLALALTLLASLVVPAAAYTPGVVGQNTTMTTATAAKEGSGVLVIKPDNTLWTWGNSTIMPSQSGDVKTPQKVLDNVASVSAGREYVAALKTDGSLWMWGSNMYGQLGNGTTADVKTPTKMMDGVSAVSCGRAHTAVIKTDGSLWMWGYNDSGELGNSQQFNARSTESDPTLSGTLGAGTDTGKPIQTVPVKIMDNVRSVSCGFETTYAVTADGTLWGWGFNGDSCLGLGGTGFKDTAIGNAQNAQGGKIQTVPTKIMDGVSTVSTCGGASGAIKTDGTLWMWGENRYGQLGNNMEGNLNRSPFIYQTFPVQVMTDVASVYPLTSVTYIIKKDGSLWGCGRKDWLGVGDSSNAPQATPVKMMDNVSVVNGTGALNWAVKTDGSLWAWGTGYVNNWGMGDQTIRTPAQYPNMTVKAPGASTPASTTTTSTATATPTAGGFSDVPSSSPYADAIVWAVKQGITSGKSAGVFAPGEDCTNGQILTFLWRASGSPEPAIANPYLDPVPASFQKAAIWASEQGLISGTTFGASTPCTRAMTVYYLWQAAGSPEPTAASSFSDVPGNALYAKAVAWAVEKGITSGTGNGTFSPDKTCTRGQIVTFLYRANA